MSSMRTFGCLALFAVGCAAQSSSGPSPQGPDAAVTGMGAGGRGGESGGGAGSGAGGSGAGGSSLEPDAATTSSADTGAPSGGDQPDATPIAADSAPATADSAPVSTGGGNYTCTMIIGINATSEWYTQGFETMVDNAKYEIVRVHSGFVELWADPKNAVWNTGPSSACAMNANNPDRVVFVALNFDQTTLAWWLPPVQAVVKNLQAKYSNLKRIELQTFVRAPGDMPCPQGPAYRSTISPAEDQAIAMVAAMNPGLVIQSPKFEAKTCSEFSGNPPHPSAAGGKAWAKMMADYYNGQGK